MEYFTLRKHNNGTILHKGEFEDFRHCLEDAVNRNIDLSYIDLKNQNLSNVNIDGAHMPYADFSSSNLSGANLSEATLHNSNFSDTSLYNCCMSYSNLHECNFCGASFGGTLIDYTDLGNSIFSTLSCFDLDFIYCTNLNGCKFIEPNNRYYEMSGAPIVIKNMLNKPIIMFDKTIKIGNKAIKRSSMPNFLSILSKYTYQQKQNTDKAA